MNQYSNQRYSARYTYPVPSAELRLYSRDHTFFNVAREVSTLSSYKKVHIGCVAVFGHRIVSSGYNTEKSDPLQKELNTIRFYDNERTGCVHSSHAEIRCLKPLMNDKNVQMSQVKLYLYRQTRDGVPALSRPCVSCMKLIKDLGIRTIYYTGDGEFFKEDIYTGTMYLLQH